MGLRATCHSKAKSMTESRCRFTLRDNERTKPHYPFEFVFTIDYAVTDDALEITFRVRNTGTEILPVSWGGHPAFNWPLADGVAKNDHRLEFSHEETQPVRRIEDGLVVPQGFKNPIMGDTLVLQEELFAHDAIIMDNPASKSVKFVAPGQAGLEVSWDDGFRELGLWSRPNDGDALHCANFLCIEPWHGFSSPAGFDGDITEKPGIMLVPGGGERQAVYKIRLLNLATR